MAAAATVVSCRDSSGSTSTSTTKLLETKFENGEVGPLRTLNHLPVNITANLCYDTPLVGGSCTNSPFVGSKLRNVGGMGKKPALCSSAINLPAASAMETPQLARMKAAAANKVAPCSNTLPSPTRDHDGDEAEHQYDIPFSHLQVSLTNSQAF